MAPIVRLFKPTIYPPDHRSSSPHAITVETTSIPPSATDRLRYHLEHAAVWAPDIGAEIVDVIRDLISKTKGRAA